MSNKNIDNATWGNLKYRLKTFFDKFNIEIKNVDTYYNALTHNSYANEYNLDFNYQRLEFLGDAILQQTISLYLYKKYSDKKEGEITSLRSKIVRDATLASIAIHLDLGRLVLLGKGELKTGGIEKTSILSDVYESLLAAIYLDNDESVVHKFVEETLIKYCDENDIVNEIKDHKTELQEYLQADNKRTLNYVVAKETIDPTSKKLFIKLQLTLII